MGKVIEFLRIILVALGYFLAYATSPEHTLFWLVALMVIPLTFLSGIEGMFFAKSSLVSKDWGSNNNRYKIQGRLNFLAVALTAAIVLIFKMNIQAQLVICLVALIFFAMSSINHLLSYLTEKTSGIQLERFLLTILLWGGFIPLFLKIKHLL